MPDTTPPRPVTGEQPVYQPTTDNIWLQLKNVLGAAAFLVAAGGFLYQSRAVAADVEAVKVEITKKADKSQGEEREKRLQQLERFVAVQVQINEQQAKANEAQVKANEKNEAQHEKILEKLDKALSRKP